LFARSIARSGQQNLLAAPRLPSQNPDYSSV
jgi:hypothetical protein